MSGHRGSPHLFRPSSDTAAAATAGSALQHHFLRRSPYRPAYPSPLSQQPLQASVSSSRTGGGASSRSVTSARTTSTSATSRFSITQAFSSLRNHEVRFFDHVIELLPPHAADFAQLKKAYNVVLSSEIDARAQQRTGRRDGGHDDGDEDEEWDTNLWSCLLSLVKVRGHDWKDRWDSVRMALGLDPRSSGDDDDDQGQTTQSQSPDDSQDGSQDDPSGSSTEDESSDADPRHWHARQQQRRPPSPPVQLPVQRTVAGQKRKTAVPHSRNEAMGGRQSPHRQKASRLDPSAAARSPAPHHHRDSNSAGPRPSRLRTRAHSYDQPQRSSSLEERIERRRLLQLGVGSLTGTADDSMAYHDSESLESARARLQRLRLHSHGHDRGHTAAEESHIDTSMSEPEDFGGPSMAQKRFQEVVRNSLAEREAIRSARAARKEAEEEQQWSEEAQRADRIFAHRLLRTTLGWWLALTRRQAEHARNAQEVHDRIVVARTWDRWKEAAQQEAAERTRADKIDRVRCKLGAWRRWRRVCKQRAEARQVEKKETLKRAYYQVARRQKERVARDAYQAWRGLYLERVADAIRRRHLQQGAFAIWQLRLGRSSDLRALELEMAQRYRFRLLEARWTQWHRRATLSTAEQTLIVGIDRHLLAEALTQWRKQTLLHELAEAFVRRRLQTVAFVGWTEARAAAAEQRRKEALADRWRNRKAKRTALQHWQRRLSRLDEHEQRADRLVRQVDERRKAATLAIWVTKERGTLLIRVRQARTVETFFTRWRQQHHSLATSLAQRESRVVARRDHAALAASVDRWRWRLSSVAAMQSLAVDTDVARVRFTLFDLWRRKLEAHALDERQAGLFHHTSVQRRALGVWTARICQSRLDALLADRDRRLLATAMTTWQSRLMQRREDQGRLARFVSVRERRISQKAMQHWLHLTIERRNAELNATLYHRLQMQQRTFYHWISLCLKHDDMLNLVQSQLDLKRETELRRHFHRWLERACQERQRKSRLSTLLAARRTAVLAGGFETWRSKLLESKLQEVEYEVTLKHHEVTLLRLFRTWKEQTSTLPAVRMRNSHLKRLAMTKWKTALPGMVRRRRAREMDEAKLMRETVERWRERWREKKRLRAAQRFGAVGMERLRRRSGSRSHLPPLPLV